jgi:hypothetical protein
MIRLLLKAKRADSIWNQPFLKELNNKTIP